MTLLNQLRFDANTTRKELFWALVIVLFGVSAPIAGMLYNTPLLLILLLAVAGLFQAYNITRWVYTLKPGNRSTVMTLWLATLTLMIIHSAQWSTQGEAYNAHGLLGNTVDVMITLFAIVLWRQTKTCTPIQQ